MNMNFLSAISLRLRQADTNERLYALSKTGKLFHMEDGNLDESELIEYFEHGAHNNQNLEIKTSAEDM